MAYDPNVPSAPNQVRGASGDLVKMQQNFEALHPIIQSGLNALLSGGTAASGALAVAQGTGNAQWHYTTLAALAAVLLSLDDLSDVNAPSPNDGEVLKWDSGTSMWVPAADSGGGAGGGGVTLDSFAVLSMTSGAYLAVPSGTFTRVLSGGASLATGQQTTGGWTVNTTSGLIRVPPVSSGLTHIRMHGQVTWSGAAGGGGPHNIRVRVSGTDGETFPVYFHPLMSTRESPGQQFTQNLVTPLIAISGHEYVWLEAEHNDSSTRHLFGGDDPHNGRLTYLACQAYKASGASAGGAGLWYQCRVTMASAQTRSIASGTPTNNVLSGGVEQLNIGGWSSDVTTSGSITVPTGKGITHVRINAQVAWGNAGNGTGYRDCVVRKWDANGNQVGDAGANIAEPYTDGGLQPRDRRPGQLNAIQSYQTPLIQVSGGERFQLGVVHTDSAGSENVVGGIAAKGGLTYMDIQGFILTSGT